jgi:endo-1,4-beta-xylanase
MKIKRLFGLRGLKSRNSLIVTAVLIGLLSGLFYLDGKRQMTVNADSHETLRTYADRMHFWFGTTLQGLFWNNPKYVQLVSTHFNSGVSIVLFQTNQPEQGRFDFHIIDSQKEFAQQHDMKLFGVALIYRPAEAPAWFFPACRTWSKEKLDAVMKERIQTIVRRGGDTYYGWEVVNEPTQGTHNGCWSKVLGDYDYIAKAFRYADEANPKAELLLNDGFGHDGVDKVHAKEFFDIIRHLKADKIRIDAAGIQMHLRPENLHPGYVDEFKWFLSEARNIGVQVQVTEMDVMLPPGGGPDLLQKQREMYYNILHTCLKDTNCTGFTVWGTGDALRHRKENDPEGDGFMQQRPLPFDANLEPKPAFDGLMQALKEGR